MSAPHSSGPAPSHSRKRLPPDLVDALARILGEALVQQFDDDEEAARNVALTEPMVGSPGGFAHHEQEPAA